MKSELSPEYQDDLHPRVFFSEKDIGSFKVKAEDGFCREVLTELLSRCRAYCDPAHERYVNTEGNRLALIGEGAWGSRTSAPMSNLAFAYLLTDDPCWLEKAKETLLLMASAVPSSKAFNFPFNITYGTGEPICIANLHGHLPLAFDILYHHLSSDEQNLIASYIRNNIVAPYRDNYLGHPARFAGVLGQNPPWHEMHTYIWSLAAIFDSEREEDVRAMKQAVDLVRKAIHLGVDSTGVIGEGPNYGRLDTFRWVTCAEAIRRTGMYDFWKQEPRFNRLFDHWVDILLPGRCDFINRCDASIGCGGDVLWFLLIHARNTGNPVFQYVWERTGGRDNITGLDSVQGIPGPLGFYFIWDQKDAKRSSPDQVDWPRAKAPGEYGVHIFRTGWGKEDFFFNLLSAGRNHGCYIHQHMDAGHFSLYALGEAFSIEGGYGDIQGKHHAVMLPKGQEPESSPTRSFEQAWYGGHNHKFKSGKNADYASVNIAWVMECFWYYRHALIVRAPGADAYVLIFDNANYNSNWGTYDWLINTHPDNTVTVDNNALTAVIQGKKNRLEIGWAFPGPENYPKSHSLRLVTDEIDSDCIVRGKAMGIGRRPRLKATLTGYNGLLLSALIPRRSANNNVSFNTFHAPNQFGLEIDHGDVIDTVLCNSLGDLDAAGINGEASVAVARKDRQGKLLWWCATEVYALSIDGQQVMPRQGMEEILAEM